MSFFYYRPFFFQLKKVFAVFLFVTIFLFPVKFLSAQAPVISSFSPSQVCTGETVTINGTGFTGATAVKLGGTDAADFNVIDATKITAVAASAGNGTVSVTTPKGTVSSSGSLTVLLSPNPVLIDESNISDPFTNCDGNSTYQLVVKNASSCGSNGTCNYVINWGDGSPQFTQADWPSGAQTMHTYTAQGYFNVKLTITSANGCVKSKGYNFYNGTNPLASFTTTTSTTGLCTPAPIQFQIGNWFNNSTGTSYHVNFGDGTPEVVLQHPLNTTNTDFLISHTYNTTSCPSSPDFTATLMAVNGCFVTTYTLNQIVIRKKPVADFNPSVTTVCLNTPVCFTNTTTDGYSGNSCNSTTGYVWNFGDGSTPDNAASPCHTYNTLGTFNVTLTATNQACGNDTKTMPVTVKPETLPPTVTTPVIYCQNQPALPLTATGSSLMWYLNSTGPGSSTPIIPLTNLPGSQTYYVTQTMNGCESPKVPITVKTNSLPAAPIVTSPVQYCQNANATPLSATGTGLLWYTTATGGTGSTTPPTPSTTAIKTTSYYVSQAINNCEGPRAEIEVTVNSLATAPVVTPSLTYCQNEVAPPLTATGSSLLWYTTATGGIGTSTAPTPSTSTADTTIYYVSQVTGCGESSRSSITVIVKARPSASIGYTPANLCNVVNSAATPNPVVNVTFSGTIGGSYTISPSSGLIINAANGAVNPSGATTGNYIISYTIPGTGSCPDYSTTATVNVNGSPAATVTYPASICTSEGNVQVALSGSGGGEFTSTSGLMIDKVTGTITPAASTPGSYVVTYTIQPSSPCPGFSITANVTITKAPSATISYTPSALCNVENSAATPNPPVNVTLAGTSGGDYSISPSTGLAINTSTGALSPSGATAGAYTITYTITGAGGCADFSTTTNISVNNTPTATISYPGSPYCGGINTQQPVIISGIAQGTFSSDPALSLNKTTGEINPSLSKPGTYTITYTIPPSPPCPGYTATSIVIINEAPVLTFPVSTETICSGGTLVFTPVSNLANTIYNWSVVGGALPGGVTGEISGTTSQGNSNISISYTNTGTASQTIKIEVIPVNPTQSPCNGAPYYLTAIINPIPAAPITEDTVGYCLGTPGVPLTSIFLPGNHLNWYNENMLLLPSAPIPVTTSPAVFVYYVSQSDGQCESPKARITAIVYPTPRIISAAYTNPTLCGVPSGSISLNILDLNNNPIPNTPVVVHYDKFQTAYKIPDTTNASGDLVIPLTAGTYSGIYLEVNGCASKKIPNIYVLKDPSPPAQPVAGYNPPLCSETPLTLSALSATSTLINPIDYVWVGPAFGNLADTVRTTVITFPSADISFAGTYIVYTIQNNCISPPTSFPVTIKQSPVKPVITTRAPLCIGDILNLQSVSSLPGADPASLLTYTWTGPGRGFPVKGPNAQINSVIIQDAGVYTTTVTSSSTGCSSKTDTLINIGGYPIVKYSQKSLVLPAGYILNLTPSILNADDPHILPIKMLSFSPNADINCSDPACLLPLATIKNDVCYTVNATNVYGCSGSDTLCVKVFCENTQVFIPNAFTPQGGLPENSILMVRGSGIASIKSFRVFNRWGQIVFERDNFPPNSPAYGWDGRINGIPAEPAVFVYTAEVICENGIPYTYKGNVTLIK